MITKKTLKLSLKSLHDFAKKRLPDEMLIELDERDECPEDIVHYMCNPDQLDIQLLFILQRDQKVDLLFDICLEPCLVPFQLILTLRKT